MRAVRLGWPVAFVIVARKCNFTSAIMTIHNSIECCVLNSATDVSSIAPRTYGDIW